MEYTIIEVPDLNDSMSRVVLNGKAYLIRFTWNDRGGFWKFGLYLSIIHNYEPTRPHYIS